LTKVVSLRLRDDQVERLQRAARRLGRTASEAAALLLEEALRQRDFTFIEFRDSPVGRQAYLKGMRLAVWQVVSVTRSLGGDTARAAAHLELPPVQVAAALRYAEAFPQEIEAAIADNARAPADLGRLIPGLELVEVDAASAG
jgi:uncharacterized protein (DUF433 family)